MLQSRISILCIKLAMRFCHFGFTHDYLVQALESERAFIEYRR